MHGPSIYRVLLNQRYSPKPDPKLQGEIHDICACILSSKERGAPRALKLKAVFSASHGLPDSKHGFVAKEFGTSAVRT